VPGVPQAALVALRAALYYAINEQLAPAVRAAAAGIDVKAVLTAALPPVPSIADLLAVRALAGSPWLG
jgi:hypothetical protein